MADGFTKLHNGLLTSTVWREDPATKVVWITLLAMADPDGVVESTMPGLGAFANVTIDEAAKAIEKFLSPDRYSRTPDREGRRIEIIPGGWRLLNYDKYRDKSSTEELRQKATARQQRRRERLRNANVVTRRDDSVTKRDSRDMSLESRQADLDLEAEANKTHGASDFDGSEWALRTMKEYPLWADPDAMVVHPRLADIYMQTIEAEAPSRGGLLRTAEWFLDVTREFAKQCAGKDSKFIMGLERFLRGGYVEVKLPFGQRKSSTLAPLESDEAAEKRLRAEARQRRAEAQGAVAG